MKIASSISAIIGNTPLVQLNNLTKGVPNRIAVKLESFNPGCSVKDRAALGMIEDAEQRGVLKPGGTIVEATSGNTGIALAIIAAERRYRLIIAMPESMSIERRKLLAALGAKVVLTPAHLGMAGALERAQELARENDGAFVVNQFQNRANPAIHEVTTAEEILRDTEGSINVFVAGVGTGGTISGVGRRLKKHNPAIRVVAVEPAGAPLLSGGQAGPHMIQGIGAGFIPQILDQSVIDEVVCVTDVESMAMTRSLMSGEGIVAGISSGAAVCGALHYIKMNRLTNNLVVVLLPDTGERYLSMMSNGNK
jgi:cysteine synthase A